MLGGNWSLSFFCSLQNAQVPWETSYFLETHRPYIKYSGLRLLTQLVK